jgi:hypothetical protein
MLKRETEQMEGTPSLSMGDPNLLPCFIFRFRVPEYSDCRWRYGPMTADRGSRWCDPLQRPFLDAKRELHSLA